METLRILSTNYSGQSANITFSPATGGTQVINGITIPYDFTDDFVFGDYSVFFPSFNNTCPLNVPVPDPVLSQTGATQYENVVLSASSVLDGGTYIWTLTDFYSTGDTLVSSYTGQTLIEGYFTSTGNTNVRLDVVLGSLTSTTTDFVVNELQLRPIIFASGENTQTAQYSYDGINWSSTTLTNSGNWNSSIIENNVIVVSNSARNIQNNKVNVSENAINWSGVSIASNARFNTFAYSEFLGNVIISSSFETTQDGFYTTDGVNWSGFTYPDVSTRCLLSDELNDEIIIAVGQTSGFAIKKSNDLSTWTTIDTGTRFEACLWNETLGLSLFFDNGNGGGKISNDATNWTGITTNLGGTLTASSAAYRKSDGRMTIITYQTDEARVSDDGINWSASTLPSGYGGYIGITYSEESNQFVVVSRDGTPMTSPDGFTWTIRTRAASFDCRQVSSGLIV